MKNPLYFSLPVIFTAALLFGADVYFSPNGGVADQIIKRINLSKSTIDISVYSFTSGDIAQALVDAHKRGVKVRVIRDRGQSGGKRPAPLQSGRAFFFF